MNPCYYARIKVLRKPLAILLLTIGVAGLIPRSHADTLSSGVEAAYTLVNPPMSSGNYGAVQTFGQNAQENVTIGQELKGTVNNPDPPFSGGSPEAPSGYSILIKTVIPDRLYQVIGFGGRAGNNPEVKGWIRFAGGVSILGLGTNLTINGRNMQSPSNASDATNLRLTVLNSTSVSFHSRSSCYCGLSDGAGIFFSVLALTTPSTSPDRQTGLLASPLWAEWWFWTIAGLSVVSATLFISNIQSIRSLSKQRAETPSFRRMNTSVCQQCGAQMPSASVFCGNCGAKLGESVETKERSA